jgi:hypothetical protein
MRVSIRLRLARPAGAILLALAAVAIAIPVGAQDGTATTSYDAGNALLISTGGAVGTAKVDLSRGQLDPATGGLSLEYRPDCARPCPAKPSLTVRAPGLPGSYVAPPAPPRDTELHYTRGKGFSGARGDCALSWATLANGSVSGSYDCLSERKAKGKKKPRFELHGTFAAQPVLADPAMAVTAASTVLPMGATADLGGDQVTPLGFVDLDSLCVTGAAKPAARGACLEGEKPLKGTWRAITLRYCVADINPQVRVAELGSWSRILFAGDPYRPSPAGAVGRAVDPTLATVARFDSAPVDFGLCGEGYVIAADRGPLLLWQTPGGQSIGWTMDESWLPPTTGAQPGASASPGPSATPAGPGCLESVAYDLLYGNAGLVQTLPTDIQERIANALEAWDPGDDPAFSGFDEVRDALVQAIRDGDAGGMAEQSAALVRGWQIPRCQ